MTSELADRLQSSLGSSYRIERELGGGGMSQVFVAEEAALGRKVVVKVLRPELAAEMSTERFKREILFAARLQHPHIVPVLTAGESGGLPFYTMPFVPGESLETRLAREGPLAMADAVRLLAGIARALAYAHRCGVVHRDIKPGNVLVVDGTAVVTDFGIAKAILRATAPENGESRSAADLETTRLTQVGTTIGTPAYMAPEQMAADPATDHRADIYSFGVLAFELLAGRRPFMATSYQKLIVAHLTELPPKLDDLRPGLPTELVSLIARCLEKDPQHRPASAEALVSALDAIGAAPGTSTGELADDAALGIPLVTAAIPAAGDAPLRPIIAREAQEAELAESFQMATTDHGLVHAVVGEAGLGKTTLVDHFLATLGADHGKCRVGRGRCSERLAGTEAYLPFLEALETLLAGRGGAAVAREMRALAPAWYAQVHPATTSDPSGTRTPAENRGGSSEQMMRQLGSLFVELTRSAPLVLFLEDVHWADASTVDLIAYLADRFDALRILLIVTYRPSDLFVARHPFADVQLTLQARGAIRETSLRAFDRKDLDAYLAMEYPGNRFPDEFVSLLHARTQGTPLFVVDLMRQLADRNVISEHDGEWTLDETVEGVESELPQSIRSVIQRTIDRLDEADRRLLVAASVQGAEFDSAVVAAAIQMDSAAVEERLDRLEKVYAIVRFVDERVLARRTPSLRYEFVHILYQNTLFATVRATRRAALSAAVANAMEECYGHDPSHASALGVLHMSARQFDRAAARFLQATKTASRLFASKEAVLLARRGLEALEALPDSVERARLELELQIALGVPLTDLHGYTAPEVEHAYSRARELCSRVGDAQSLIPVLHGLYRFYTVRGRLHAGREIVEQLITVAEGTGDAKQIFIARAAMGAPLVQLGEFELAFEYLKQGMTGYESGVDRVALGTFMPQAWLAVVLWLLGRPDEALVANREAREFAERQQNPFAVAYGESLTAWLHQYRGDAALVKHHAEACIEVSRAYDYRQWLALGAMFQGWALVALNGDEKGLAQLMGAIDSFRRTGAEMNLPHFLSLLADAHLRLDNAQAGLEAIDQAIAVATKNDDRCWEPELHRLRGELLLKLGDRDAAESAFRSALSVAAAQSSRSLELRAALSLARKLTDEQNSDAARAMLAGAVGNFPSHVRTEELDEARALLLRPRE
jgi:predicted ATPase/tRNA A-37 threonylcarbamoyl transferase component Bud32